MNTRINKQQWQEEEALRRFQLISPLLQADLDDAKRIQLLQAKENVGQLARAYLLKMETVGYDRRGEGRTEKTGRRSRLCGSNPQGCKAHGHQSEKIMELFEVRCDESMGNI